MDPLTTCLVCSEIGASKHYGSICCSGCKGFFRRTVRFNRKYECFYDKNCIIQKEFRNCCRACRFSKCIQIGLNSLMIHSDRIVAKTAIKIELDDSQPCSSTNSNHFNDKSLEILPYNITKKEIISDFEDDLCHWKNLFINNSKKLCQINNKTLGSAKIIPTFDKTDFHSVSEYFVLVEKLIDEFFETDKNHVFASEKDHHLSLNVPIKKAFREPREICRRSKIDWLSRYYLKASDLHKVWCRILTHYVDWVSHIPELSQLDNDDQLALMIARSIPCVWITIAQRSMVNNTDGISLSGGAYFPRGEEDQKQIDKEIYPFLKKISDLVIEEFMEPAKEMKMSMEEYAILRIICFFMPVSSLSSRGKVIVRQARNFYRNILVQIVRAKFPQWQNDQVTNRISQLFCFLPVMETAGQIEDDNLAMMTLFNVANMQGELTYEIHIRKVR